MTSESYKKWRGKEGALEKKRETMRRLRAASPEKYNAQSAKARLRERERIYEMYGHACVRCGFNDKRALTLDHINNDGNIERAEI